MEILITWRSWRVLVTTSYNLFKRGHRAAEPPGTPPCRIRPCGLTRRCHRWVSLKSYCRSPGIDGLITGEKRHFFQELMIVDADFFGTQGNLGKYMRILVLIRNNTKTLQQQVTHLRLLFLHQLFFEYFNYLWQHSVKVEWTKILWFGQPVFYRKQFHQCDEHYQVVVSNNFYFYPYLGKWFNLTNIF